MTRTHLLPGTLIRASLFFFLSLFFVSSTVALAMTPNAVHDRGHPLAAPVLIVIDKQVNDRHALLEDWRRMPQTDVLWLDDQRPGLVQITDYLARTEQRYGAVHIVSHAVESALLIGNSRLSYEQLDGYGASLSQWQYSLTEDADILLYGCQLTASASGQALVSKLATLTHADVAASTTLTGAAQLGGDWVLETRIGTVQTEALTAPAWKGVLAPLVISPIDYPIRESDGMQSGEPDVSGLSLPFAAGDSALWSNAGTIGGESIDVRATIVSFNDTSGVGAGAVSFSTSEDDLWVQVNSGEAVIRWEIFQSGTGQAVVATGNPQFTISDIDGDGSASAFPALQIEAVIPALQSLTSYTFDTPTNLESGVVGASLVVRGTQNESGGQTSLVRFDWNNVSAWTVEYQAASATGVRYFYHDGDGDLAFNSASTSAFLSLDLDSNNSTIAGQHFIAATYDEGGGDVDVVDIDPLITLAAPVAAPLNSARLEISNQFPGDELLVEGSAAASGTVNIGGTVFAYTSGLVDSHWVVAFTGDGTLVEYQQLIQSVSFRNTSAHLYGETRLIEITVTDDGQSTTSSPAVAFVPINPDTDGDGVHDDADLDDDNDGMLDTAELPSAPFADADADGYEVYIDDDDGDSGIGNDDGAVESPFDVDGDGVPNHLDLDSDNDGIPDNIEAQTSTGYLAPDNTFDGFGVDTAYAGGISVPSNIDGDAAIDAQDLDSDADGIRDTTEASLVLGALVPGLNGLDDTMETSDDYMDVNGIYSATPIASFPDSDNVGGEPDWRDPQDLDNDSVAGVDDLDDDNDGLLDTRETAIVDTTAFDDGDLMFSSVWRDPSFFSSGTLGVNATEGDDYLFASNSDVGLGDTFGEATGVLDTTNWVAGMFDFTLDVSFPSLGLTQLADFSITLMAGTTPLGELTGSAPTLGNTSVYTLQAHVSDADIAAGITLTIHVPLTGDDALVVFDHFDAVGNVDFDGDGVADSDDLDSDNDGIPDNVEAQLSATYIAPALDDTDGDGLDNNYEFAGDEGLTPVNSDTVGEPDYRDTDSDDDTISDTFEAGVFLGVLDVGRNGWDDDAEIADDYGDVNGHINVPTADLPDADNDAAIGGDLDYRETDADNDRIGDSNEDMSLALPAATGDANGNDIDDAIDAVITGGTDQNANGIDDAFEPTDTDADGVPNYIDLDSDNDGIADSTEGDVQSDSDGIADFLDLDSDNDGLPDNIEAQTTAGYVAPFFDEGNFSGYDVAANGINVAYGAGLTPVNTDGADVPDYADTDADNDGELDTLEAMITLNTLDVGINGLDDDIELTDTYFDVNGRFFSNAAGPDTLPNSDGAGDVDFRALQTPVVFAQTAASDMPVIMGTHDSDTVLSVALDGAVYTEGDGSLVDNGDGTWVLSVPLALTDGVYDVMAMVVLGPLSATDSTVDELRINTTLPSITAQDVALTNNAQPLLQGTTSVAAGETVTVTNAGGDTICEATIAVGSPNTWACNPEGALAEGTNTYSATVTDTDLDTAVATFTVSIDTQAPAVTGNNVGPTHDRRPLLTGITDADAGAAVTVLSGATTVCTAVVIADPEANGWSCLPDQDLAIGTTTLQVRIADSAGNQGTDTFDVTITEAVPSLSIEPIAVDDVIDGIEDERDVDVSGTSVDAFNEEVAVTVADETYLTTTNALSGAWRVTIPAARVQQFALTEVVNARFTGAIGDGMEGEARIVRRDGDADDDGIPDHIEAGADRLMPIDSDGDLIADYLDTDSDNDGLPDALENGVSLGSDQDNDGIDDAYDVNMTDGSDSDGDGIDDAIRPVDTDGDGVADVVDVDSDNDGITDTVESGSRPQSRDTDADGILDQRDRDADGDGIADVIEGDFDTDQDGLPDYLDVDADGDGVLDTIESGLVVEAIGIDTDSDGLDDAFDADAGGTDVNNNGIRDEAEVRDTDLDGYPDFLDIDADGDGIVDLIEVQSSEGYAAPSGTDVDADGLDDAFDDDLSAGIASSVGILPVDSNNDGIPDYLSLDADGDGVDDTTEAFGVDASPTVDSDGDGLDDAFDQFDRTTSVNPSLNATNNNQADDGFLDGQSANSQSGGEADWRDGGAAQFDTTDSDGDGIPDVSDTDDDNDGILDSAEPSGDVDGDGLPNRLDLDSDNDGILDALESGGNGLFPVDSDGDGTPDFLDDDADNDGLPDILEFTTLTVLQGADGDGDGIDDGVDVDETGGVDVNSNSIDDAFEPIDTDGDGLADYVDPDSDNDGIPDTIEAGAMPSLTGQDSDGDGIDDAFDVDQTGGVDANADGVDDLTQPADTNRDGLPDHLVTDSDSDGITDRVEADSTGTDSDGDGIDDRFDVSVTGGPDLNGDGVDDSVVPTDTDGDGRPDYLDLDSDNDGISDVVEAGMPDSNGDGRVDAGNETLAPNNTDGADQPDFRDLDSDNDGQFDLLTVGLLAFDADGDGAIDDASDLDGDGVPDVVDGQPGVFSIGTDFDGDGVNDRLDLDADNDGIPNAIETMGGAFELDTDGDGIPNYLDLDSDNDGVSDLIEGGHGGLDTDANGQIDMMIDANGDGLMDSIDPTVSPDDVDNDGMPDFVDTDSDNDSVSDLEEAGAPIELDSNNDGMIDTVALGDSDFDGLLDVVDPTVSGGLSGTPVMPVDTDGDGEPDYKDTDSDGDSVADQDETGDANGDGIADRLQAAPQPAPVSEPVSSTPSSGSGSVGALALALLMVTAVATRSRRRRRLR
ncbi:MAG: DUF4347 domain-containing protein [Pseudomonadota bacterium]